MNSIATNNPRPNKDDKYDKSPTTTLYGHEFEKLSIQPQYIDSRYSNGNNNPNYNMNQENHYPPRSYSRNVTQNINQEYIAQQQQYQQPTYSPNTTQKPDDIISNSTNSVHSYSQSSTDVSVINSNRSPHVTPKMSHASRISESGTVIEDIQKSSPSFKHPTAQTTPSFHQQNRPQHSPSFQPNRLQQSPSFQQPGLPQPMHHQMRPSISYGYNNVSRQASGFYPERPPLLPNQRPMQPPQTPQTPQMQKQPQLQPQLQPQPPLPYMQSQSTPTSTPYYRPPVHQSSPTLSQAPPPPPNHNYYGQFPSQTRLPYVPAPPPPVPTSPAPADNSYLTDSSLSVASAAGRKPKQNSFPPATKENLARYRAEAMDSEDPKLLLDFAKYLIEAVKQLNVEGVDPKRVKKTREAMLMEAQKIVKKLTAHTGMGKQGSAEAIFFLANCYGTGEMGLQPDPEKSFSLYFQGTKQGHPGCTYRAAVCYEMGAGTKKDKNHAMQFYRKAANMGDPAAMFKLGMILLKGLLGQTKNPREGISWLKRAAQQADEDYPHSLHELGLAYEKEGIPSVIPDLNYARELFTQAAQYGYAPSQFKLGLAYENGFLNCPIDPRRSIAWYSKAAEQGNMDAEFALSGWYLTGAEGVLPQNDSEAYLWARKAADKGSAKAEYAVGYYTETGVGTRQNLDEAKRWYMRAAAQNYRRAMQRLTEIKYGSARPQQKRNHTRDANGGKNVKDSDCTIM